MADYAPIIKKILSENDCHPERQGKGDHEIWYSPLTKLRFLWMEKSCLAIPQTACSNKLVYRNSFNVPSAKR